LAHLARLRAGAPYPWQWQVAEVAGEVNDRGDGFRYPIVVLSVPRRAGKTVLTLAKALRRMDMGRDVRAWYTAQRREDAAKQFRDEWAPMLDSRPSLRRLYKLRRSQGSEGIHRRHGSSRLQLFPPTENALHGMNADDVTVDEAWFFDQVTGEALEAGIRPAQLTRSWPQLWVVSAGGTLESTWWDAWLTVGEQGTPGVALFDYGADSSADDYDPGSPRTWLTHPSIGHGFPIEALAHEWHTKRDVASFERAYLNVWPRPSQAVAAAGLELAHWTAAAHPEHPVSPVTAIALDVAADRAWSSIAVAGPDPSHTGVLVDVVDHRPGVAWLAAGIRAVRATHRGVPVVADALVAASIVAELARARITVDTVGAADHARACGTFVDLLGAGRLAHRSQAVLDDAVTGAARRPLGDAWLWSRHRSSVDISPLVAVTLAAWAAHTRAPTGRGAVVAVADGAQPIARTRGTTRGRFAQHSAS
jgi:hypothetical protein